MKHFIKKSVAVLLAAAVFCFAAGCAGGGEKAPQTYAEAYTEPVTLRVVTEKGTNKSGSYSQDKWTLEAIRKMADTFTKEHPTVTFEFELLPADKDAREPVLQRIRTEIMAGKGPDLYLLPSTTNNPNPELQAYYNSDSFDNFYLESLFVDVNQAMHSGKFFDISPYYDGDTALDKDGLNQSVMDGGCVESARYVLPIKYTVPIVYGYVPALEKAGLSIDALSTTTETYFSTLAAHGDSAFCPGLQSTFFSAFSQLYDYEKEQVAVNLDSMVSFLKAYQDYELYANGTLPPMELLHHSSQDVSAVSEEAPMIADELNETTLQMVVNAKLRGDEMAMIPLNTSDGTLAAKVTYWSAVGAACQHPQEAYDFLTQFLSSEFQDGESHQGGMDLGAYQSWPVRTNGLISTIWDNYRNIYAMTEEAKEIDLTDEDFPILQAEIGSVRFETGWEDDLNMLMINRMLDWDGMDRQPSAESLEDIAQDILDELRWRIQE